jgi:hypothetical protein
MRTHIYLEFILVYMRLLIALHIYLEFILVYVSPYCYMQRLVPLQHYP